MARICVRAGTSAYVADLIGENFVTITLVERGREPRRHTSGFRAGCLVSCPEWLPGAMRDALLGAIATVLQPQVPKAAHRSEQLTLREEDLPLLRASQRPTLPASEPRPSVSA
jgi:hypothetical protein